MATSSKRRTVSIGGKNYKAGSKAATTAISGGGTVSKDPGQIRANADASKARTTARENGTDYTPPSTLTSAELTPTSAINIPPPAPQSTAGTSAMLQVGGLAAPANAPTTTATSKPGDTAFADTSFQDYLKSITAPPSTEKIYDKAEREAGVNEKQALVNTYTNQLNAIVAKSQADKLSLVGQGRGVTDVIIGGQQAQIDREAAIQSLPIAAQLTAAQGDLEMAKSHLDTLFKIRTEDATNKYNHKTKVAEAVYNYADKKQKTALDAKMKQDDREFSMMTNQLNYAQSVALKAIENGQPSLAARIMALDPSSSTYRQNVADAAKGIYVAPKSSGGGGTIEERQASAISYISSKIVPKATLPSGVTILNPDGSYINPVAWKEMIANAPSAGLTRKVFIENFGDKLYIDTKTNKPSPNYGLTPKEMKDLGYE